jgi:hypothetical protein
VIRAEAALRLPTAQLSEEELRKADTVEREIETLVLKGMERRGVDLNIAETSSNIIAEVNQRLKQAGYNAQWQALIESHPLNKAMNKLVGFKLSLSPTDESYRAAEALSAIAQS